MTDHQIAKHAEWVEARRRLLAREKELQRLRDEVARERRALPWERVEKRYEFDAPGGKESFADLFGGKSQLIVYHLMFAPEWETACKSCSFWADQFSATAPHLAQRDVALVGISRAPLAKLQAFAKRLGWSFKWVSSGNSDFNFDYHVSFRPEDVKRGVTEYNYQGYDKPMTDLPGFSVFYKDADGAIYHTYSTYARGLDPINSAYQLLDLAPKGRDEDQLPQPMAWVKLHDLYSA